MFNLNQIPMKKTVMAGAAAAALLLGGGALAFHERDVALTEMPERVAPPADEQSHDEVSRVLVSAKIDLETIRQAIEAKAPQSFDAKGSTRVWHKVDKVLNVTVLDASIDATHDLTIKRTAIEIYGENDAIVAKTKFKVDGKVGLKGLGCKILKCDKKNVNADGTFKVIFRKNGSDELGRPRFEAHLEVDVKQATLEVLPGIDLNLTSEVERAAKDKLSDIEKQLRSAMSPEALAAMIETEAWKQVVSPIKLMDENLYLVSTPQSLDISQLVVADGQVQLALAVSAKTEIVSVAPDPSAWKEPVKFGQAEFGESRISLVLPMTVSWDKIDKLIGANLPFEVKAKDIGIKVTAANVYPAGDKIAVKFKSHFDLPDLFDDAQGDIGMTGKLTTEMTKDGPVLALKEFAFKRSLDNLAVKVLTAAAETLIIEKAEAAARIPLADLSDKAMAAANDALSAQASQLGVDAQLTDLSVTSVSATPTEAGLALFVKLEAGFTAKAPGMEAFNRP